MQCPYCGSTALKVLDTTDTKSGIRRRRECNNCEQRFTTYERPLSATPVLIKSDGNREEFDREKLKRGIWNACAKRPIPAAEIDKLANHIETYLQSLGRPEVSSHVVGDMVIQGLKDLDPIAYIRYAIVYLGLDNLLSVRSEIDKLLAEEHSKQGAAFDAQPSTTEPTPAAHAEPDADVQSPEVSRLTAVAAKAKRSAATVRPSPSGISGMTVTPGSHPPKI
jgi:transcriptional repressor NrdR